MKIELKKKPEAKSYALNTVTEGIYVVTHSNNDPDTEEYLQVGDYLLVLEGWNGNKVYINIRTSHAHINISSGLSSGTVVLKRTNQIESVTLYNDYTESAI